MDETGLDSVREIAAKNAEDAEDTEEEKMGIQTKFSSSASSAFSECSAAMSVAGFRAKTLCV